MKIQVRKIRPEGVNLEESFSAETIGLTDMDAVHFTSPVEVKAKITRPDNEVLAKIQANSQYESLCSRCLDDVQRQWTVDFTLTFDVDKTTEFITMDKDICQEIILNLPTNILCQPGCKGLCVDCGANLNKKECKHTSRKVATSPRHTVM